jgi:hypothetical protein
MTETLKQKFNNEIIKLPKVNQESINSIDWIKITDEIGEKFLLNEDQVENLQVETCLVLVGLVDLSIYSLNIENSLNINKEDSLKIGKEVYEKIFIPISVYMESLVKNKVKLQNPKWYQSVNFILMGGDYSAFLNEENEKSVKNDSSVNDL